MATKVLVFESDPAFAGELRSEFGKLGCVTTVVEDGNLGLQQAAADRPDLILLSIELPRMNGFSVCNKLKKLRTRAEDYVHKPIAFGELLQHIQGLVPMAGAAQESDGAIVIDDEIEIGSTDYLGDERSGDSMPDIPPAASTARRIESVDADVDAFAESAFGRLTGPDASAGEVHASRNGARSVEASTSAHLGVAAAPASARV